MTTLNPRSLYNDALRIYGTALHDNYYHLATFAQEMGLVKFMRRLAYIKMYPCGPFQFLLDGIDVQDGGLYTTTSAAHLPEEHCVFTGEYGEVWLALQDVHQYTRGVVYKDKFAVRSLHPGMLQVVLDRIMLRIDSYESDIDDIEFEDGSEETPRAIKSYAADAKLWKKKLRLKNFHIALSAYMTQHGLSADEGRPSGVKTDDIDFNFVASTNRRVVKMPAVTKREACEEFYIKHESDPISLLALG